MDIDYTSKDFAGIKADLISLISERTGTAWNPTDYSDLGNVLVESFAYMGDLMSHYIDRAANETSIDNAVQTDTLLGFANLFDYKPAGPTPATIQVTFTNISSNSVDIPVGTQVLAPLNYGSYSVAYFETTAAAIALAPSASITLTALEGKTVNTDRPDLIDPTYNKPLPANVGTSTGKPNQVFTIIDSNIIDSSLVVYVGQGVAFSQWKYVDSLIEYGPRDNVFTTLRNSDGTTSLVFGDSIRGAIPATGQVISALYRTSVGIAGNIKSLSLTEVSFIPGNVDPQATTYLTVSNALPSTGGTDPEDLTQLRKKIKAAISSRQRAISLHDYETLALMVPQVGKASASTANQFTVNVAIQAQYDGTFTPGSTLSVLPIGATAGVSDGSITTYTTIDPHGLAVGDIVSVFGLAPNTFNTYTTPVYTVPTPNTFTLNFGSGGAGVTSNTIEGIVVKNTPTTAVASIIDETHTYLSDKIAVNTYVNTFNALYTPVFLKMNVTVDPAYKNADVKLAIYQALLGTTGLFSYDNVTFNMSVPRSSVVSKVKSVGGVLDCVLTAYNIGDSSTSVGSVSDLTFSYYQIPILSPSTLSINATGGI